MLTFFTQPLNNESEVTGNHSLKLQNKKEGTFPISKENSVCDNYSN